jgi:hypothetical protein
LVDRKFVCGVSNKVHKFRVGIIDLSRICRRLQIRKRVLLHFEWLQLAQIDERSRCADADVDVEFQSGCKVDRQGSPVLFLEPARATREQDRRYRDVTAARRRRTIAISRYTVHTVNFIIDFISF